MPAADLDINLQPFTREKANQVADLFHRAVHCIDPTLYTVEQKEAWAPTPPDYAYWLARLVIKQPWLALVDNHVVGFIESDADGYIDCLYTHPDFQNQGVACALYEQLLMIANTRESDRLYVEASIVAKPFFERRGFVQIAENRVQRKGVTLINFTMEKRLVLST